MQWCFVLALRRCCFRESKNQYDIFFRTSRNYQESLASTPQTVEREHHARPPGEAMTASTEHSGAWKTYIANRAGSRKGSRPTTSRPKVYFPPRMNLEESLWHEEKSSDEPRCVADAASWVEYRQAKFGVIASKAAEDTNNARTFR
ncbi:uncharacterized protein MYCGRDRAFT_95363 [Zymoseptoria tritici IPO323]|uniref:Uncharacterized protein n=1 Tax=Zymoseptoria tritici (strain CBS 115943 / IPO323) TaxID=336722 RepID=F9XIR6_ZYMTI|nr:uncharacterized protein MYCGRDRAFT_95363 [Zymoseptoria tritici IPO323]EGP85244.1 hypothetical protein MYCGRDRAFT_95363 [Zymoseptoria tritici IPO323]